MRELWEETLCGHEGGFTAKGQPIDGMKSHPIGEPTGYNRGGGETYDEWCPGGSRRRVRIDYEAAYERYKTVTPSELTSVEMEFVRELVDAALVTEERT